MRSCLQYSHLEPWDDPNEETIQTLILKILFAVFDGPFSNFPQLSFYDFVQRMQFNPLSESKNQHILLFSEQVK